MTRTTAGPLAAILLVAAALAFVLSRDGGQGRVGAPPRVAGGGDSLEDLMIDLDVLPLDARPAPPFALETLGGARLGLADLRGRAALLYFWASW